MYHNDLFGFIPGEKFREAIQVIGDFLEHVRDERLSENELSVVASVLGRMRETEDAE